MLHLMANLCISLTKECRLVYQKVMTTDFCVIHVKSLATLVVDGRTVIVAYADAIEHHAVAYTAPSAGHSCACYVHSAE